MSTPTAKYRNLGFDPIDGVPINWRAHPDGFATRSGDSPPFIEKGRQNLATEVLFARSKCYDIPKELPEYTKTLDWIANSGGILRFEEKQPIGDGNWRVWLVWFDIRGSIPIDPNPIR